MRTIVAQKAEWYIETGRPVLYRLGSGSDCLDFCECGHACFRYDSLAECCRCESGGPFCTICAIGR